MSRWAGEWFDSDEFWTTFGPVLFNTQRLTAAPAEVDGFIRLCDLSPGARVLDLCCGPGRHTLELARRGFKVTGVDRTATYLRHLSELARNEGLRVEVARRDMRDFRRPGSYDAVLNYFTSFGYFEDPRDDVRVLENIHDSLVPGGQVLLDVLGKEVLARGYVERWWKWLEPDLLLLEEREVVRDWTWIRTHWTLLREGKRQSYTMSNRLYSASELVALLKGVGFASVRIYGDLDESPYDKDAWRLIAVAEKAELEK